MDGVSGLHASRDFIIIEVGHGLVHVNNGLQDATEWWSGPLLGPPIKDVLDKLNQFEASLANISVPLVVSRRSQTNSSTWKR